MVANNSVANVRKFAWDKLTPVQRHKLYQACEAIGDVEREIFHEFREEIEPIPHYEPPSRLGESHERYNVVLPWVDVWCKDENIEFFVPTLQHGRRVPAGHFYRSNQVDVTKLNLGSEQCMLKVRKSPQLWIPSYYDGYESETYRNRPIVADTEEEAQKIADEKYVRGVDSDHTDDYASVTKVDLVEGEYPLDTPHGGPD